MTWWLFFGTIGTAILSAAFGLAGGTLLFAMLTWVVTIRRAIFLHSIVQLISTSGRVLAFYRHICWKIVAYFSTLLLLGGYLGAMCIALLPESVVEGTVAAFVFITSFLSAKTSFHPKKWHWIAVGFLASFLGMIVAVTGPFVSIFFNQDNLSKEEQLVTKSVCHALTQVVKIVFFSFSLEMEADEMVVGLIVATLIGTFIGTKLLRYFSEKQYRQITHWLLRLIALSMLLKQFFR